MLAAYRIADFLKQEVPEPTDSARTDEHDVNLSHAQQLVATTISDSILASLGDSFFDLKPHEMFALVQQKFRPKSTPEKHQKLQDTANALCLNPGDDLDDYFEQHRALRNEMIKFAYPLISAESTTVRFIINGLRNHPDYSPACGALHVSRFQTIDDCVDAISNIPIPPPTAATHRPTTPGRAAPASSAHLWCSYHNRYGAHGTDECLALRKFVRSRRSHQSSEALPRSSSAPNPTTQPKKERKDKRRHAHNAEAEAAPSSDAPDPSDSSTEDVNATSTYSYILDSGCHPSFTPFPATDLPPAHNHVSLPNGTPRTDRRGRPHHPLHVLR